MDASERIALVNQHLGGFDRLVGLAFTKVDPDEVVAELELGEAHLQPYGLVHGGLYCMMAESVASTACALDVMPHGKSAVGLDNHTSFLRAARQGRLTARATPVIKGMRTQMWKVEIQDEAGRLLAESRVRLLVLEKGAAVAGQTVRLREPSD